MAPNNAILRKNLSHLQTLDPEIEDRILNAPDLGDELTFRSPDSSPPAELPPAPVVIALGVENWSRVRFLLKRRPRGTVVLAEPEETRIRALLEEDRASFLSQHEVLLVTGEQTARLGDEIEVYFAIASIDDLHVLSPGEDREGEFEAAQKNLRRFRRSARTNRATMDRFLTHWYGNFARNLKQYLTSPSLDRLSRQYAGQTAVVVGPGATLDHHVDELKTLSDGCVIALDTAVPILGKLNIPPDFVIVVDTGEQTPRFLDGLHPSSVLVAPPYMRPDVVEERPNTLLFDTQFPPVNWLKPELSSRGFLAVSGSVATPALDLLRWLEPSESYLVGLDLCFTDFLPYSKRSLGFEQALQKLSRFRTLPGLMLDKMREKQLRRVEVQGHILLTSEEFLGWKDPMEVILRKLNCPIFRISNRPVLPLEGTRLTDRVQSFHPSTDTTKEMFRRDATVPDAAREKLSRFGRTLGEWKIELEKIRGFQRRDNSIRSHWLEFVRTLSNDEAILRYFHWEVERLTRELQDLSGQGSDPGSVIEQQLSRWDTLISATHEGIQNLKQTPASS